MIVYYSMNDLLFAFFLCVLLRVFFVQWVIWGVTSVFSIGFGFEFKPIGLPAIPNVSISAAHLNGWVYFADSVHQHILSLLRQQLSGILLLRDTFSPANLHANFVPCATLLPYFSIHRGAREDQNE